MKLFNISCAGVILASSLFLHSELSAQVLFEKDYPSTYDRTTRDVVQTPDGGYLLVGMTNNANLFDCDLYIMKTDGMGNFIKETIYGGAKPDYAYSMVATHDGNYIVAGYTESYGGGDLDMFVVKINSNGDVISSRDIGGSGNEEGREIIKGNDNHYYIIGSSGLTGSNSQMMLVKIDVDLNEKAQWSFGGSGKEFGLALKQTNDGGFILAGQTTSKGNGAGDAYLIKLKPDMSVDWDVTYGGANNDEAVGVVANNDGSFVFAMRDSSTTSENNKTDIDIKVFKLDAGGGKVWETYYGGGEKDTPKTITSLGNGEYLVGAISRSFNDAVMPDMWLLKIKDYGTYGDTTWARFFGRANHDHCHNARPVSDGIVAIGHSRNPTQKVYFLKLSFDGRLVLSDNSIAGGLGEMDVYPNPSADAQVKVRCDKAGDYKVTVVNMLGHLVYSNEVKLASGSEAVIDLQGHAKGVYFLNIGGTNGQVGKKIVLE